VRRFVEKPDAARARRFLRRGGYLWNAGSSCGRRARSSAEIARYMPELDAAFAPLGARGRLARRDRGGLSPRALGADRHRRDGAQPTRLDAARRVALERRRHLGVARDRARRRAGRLAQVAGRGGIRRSRRQSGVGTAGRPVALLGVEGMAVVDTGDALLVARLDRSNDVREVVKALKASRRSDVT
jgi:hypothetical protein